MGSGIENFVSFRHGEGFQITPVLEPVVET